MRFSRVVIGALLICGAIWVIVMEQMAGASADAVVNAQIVNVTSPIAGFLGPDARALGEAVAKGDQVFSVSDDASDGVRLDDLKLEYDLAVVRQGVLEAKLRAVEAKRADVVKRSETYLAARLDELEIRLAEAQERLTLLSGGEVAGDTEARSRAREEAATLNVILEAAKKGVYTGNSYNDAPYSEQVAISLGDEATLLQTELDATAKEIAAIMRRIDQEKIRVIRLSRSNVTAPVQGVVWEKLTVPGSYVVRGQPVVRLVDCSAAFVTLSVTQPVFNRLRPGAVVTFRFDGSGETMEGTVARLAGTSASSFYDSLAVAPSERHLQRADVLINLPGLAKDPELRCAIGHTGRAFFETRPLDWLRGMFL
ncbi:MAG: hypothetical protein A3D16_00800 [Rhodobacterales bacterium RIFCSPHIGHO2_02_FULL_62_130]|nr:MAG: hypothetical protein A3D16_00800 [Rhodobacterales bacterium RIFCSPHIGHO2_02_FULL_62_130]OHC55210.1 MAG: hypothetical protein A3E48_10445 [Rhodobacterales bacterium RIFCSPHIGHO2_12_FULL_62_75]